MGRPNRYDDSKLLRLVADLIVKGKANPGVHAYREAIAYIPGFDRWNPTRVEQTVERLKKAYPKQREKLEKEAREQQRMLPSLLTAPRAPDLEERHRLSRELQEIANNARHLSLLLVKHPNREPAPEVVMSIRKMIAAWKEIVGE